MPTIDLVLEHRAAADSLFEEGSRRFDSDPSGAKFFLNLAGRVYDKIGDRFYRGLTRGWYTATLSALREMPSDDSAAWYNKR